MGEAWVTICIFLPGVMKETRDSSHFLSGRVSPSQQREGLAEAEVGELRNPSSTDQLP